MGGTVVGGVEDLPLVADMMVATNCTKHAILALHMEWCGEGLWVAN